MILRVLAQTPSPSTSPTPAPAPGSATSGASSVLDSHVAGVAVVAVAVAFLLVGAMVAGGRWLLNTTDSDATSSFVRSWLGLGLIAGLLISCAASLGIDDATLRSALFGGLIASAGAASAFYFASAGSDQARQDILAASGARPTVLVPDLSRQTLAEARTSLAKLRLTLVPPTGAGDGDTIIGTDPEAGTLVSAGERITART